MFFARLARQALALAFLGIVTLHVAAQEPQTPPDQQAVYQAYREVIAQTAGMVNDAEAKKLAAARGLDILNLTWEDTARFNDSAVGPNISDMTIQVQQTDPETQKAYLTCMPVIRFPNFTDKTADLKIKKFQLAVGNEKKNENLRAVSLMQYLGNFRKYLSNPNSWGGDETYLLAERDTHVLVSAQACFLPVPKSGVAEFNPVLFNYQSRPQDPAVLAILVTREGTSATVIDNARDGFGTPGGAWGQRLFHNKAGQRCSLIGQRVSDFKAVNPNPMKDPMGKDPLPKVADESSLNMVLLIQIPLQQKERPQDPCPEPGVAKSAPPAGGFKDAAMKGGETRRSDVEAAVIGHGKVEGLFTEIDGLPVKRDPRYPIRVTVQFYKATSNGVVSEKDLDDIKKEIEKVYAEGDFVGSLVVGPQMGRPTEYDGDKVEPADWWEKFWSDYYRRTGLERREVLVKLREKKGEKWTPLTEAELEREAEAFAQTWTPPAWWSKSTTWLIAGVVAVFLGMAWLFLRQRSPVTGTA